MVSVGDVVWCRVSRYWWRCTVDRVNEAEHMLWMVDDVGHLFSATFESEGAHWCRFNPETKPGNLN